MRSYHRMLALALALALMVSCLPMGALRAQAAELETTAAEEETDLTASTETVPEETEEAAAPAKETEAAAEPELPAEEAAVPKPSAEETEPKEEPQTAAEPPAEESPAEEPEVPAEITAEILSAYEEAQNDSIASGACGENLTWTLNSEGTLTISGTGEMDYYYPWDDTYAPWYGSDITSVLIKTGVTSIGDFAFNNCASITSITIPNSVTSIGNNAFEECSSLTSISIPNSVTSIGGFAFSRCSSLTSITIPASVSSIDGDAFVYCSSLTSISVDAQNPNYTSIDGVLFDKKGSTLVQYPAGKGKSAYLIPSGVTSISYSAFEGCSSLTSISIPNSVTSIDSFAFSGCSSLTSITFKGNAPKFTFNSEAFAWVTATAYYPAGNATWTSDVMQDYGGTITWKAYSTAVPATPAKPYKIANVVSGVHVYWNAVSGAEKYGLWRSETGKDGTYKWIANPTVPHFTDTTAVSGKTYYYKVTSMNPYTGEHSAKSDAIGIVYVSTPDITSRSNVAAGVKLGWEKITGATGYAIYRKSYDGDDAWVRVGTISGNSTFTWTDTSVKNNNGEIYKYTIRALAGSDMKTLSGCRNAGRTMVRLSSQVLTSAAMASSTSIKCTWTTSSRVTGYEIRFMVGSTVYKTFTVGNYKTGAKTFTGLASGETYTIQVRTYKKVDGVGSFYSDWSTAKTVTLK